MLHRATASFPALAAACGVSLLAVARPVAAQQFAYNSAALPAQNVWTNGVELVDVDGDDDVDIVFANGSTYGGAGTAGAQPQHLFLNGGAGTFTAAHAQLNVANFNAQMVLADDLDGDGDADLAYASGSTGSPPRVLLNDGSGTFTDVTATNVPVLALRSFAIATGDVDGDGDLDLAVSDGGTFGGIAAQARLLLNDGHAVFTDVTATQMPVDLFNCQDITLLDYDLDGDIDMTLAGKGGANKHGMLYLNDGAGTFTTSTGTLEAVGTNQTYETDWGDLDGDDDFDAAVMSIATQNEGWARNDGVPPMVKTTFPAPNGGDDNEMACLDYDDDLDLDVVIGSLATTEKVFRNNDGVFASVSGVFQAQGDSTLDLGIADLDGDGDYDVVTGQGESGNFTNKVYVNAGPVDSHPPRLVKSYVPAGLGDPGTIVELQLADAVSDDGHIRCSIDWTSTLLPSGGASGAATPMGGGLFRLAVPTPAGTTAATIICTASDSAGNAVVLTPIEIGAGTGGPWTDLGFSLPGTSGAPLLEGTGSLVVGQPMSLALLDAAPSAMTVLYLSFTNAPTPFKGGTLLPVPPLYSLTFLTDAMGQVVIPFPAWPRGATGMSLYFHEAVMDAGAPAGVALSNALRADIP